MVAVWQILAKDSALTESIISHFLELLQKSLPYEEKPDPRDRNEVVKSATVVPLAVRYICNTVASQWLILLPLAVCNI